MPGIAALRRLEDETGQHFEVHSALINVFVSSCLFEGVCVTTFILAPGARNPRFELPAVARFRIDPDREFREAPICCYTQYLVVFGSHERLLCLGRFCKDLLLYAVFGGFRLP